MDSMVTVLDSVLGKTIAMPLIDGNFATTSFPARYSYGINPYGPDSPIIASQKLPPPGPSDFETTIHDNVLNVNIRTSTLDAIFAIKYYPVRYSYVSGVPTGIVTPIIPMTGMFNSAAFSALLVPLGLAA
jgi:hypothetical protein